MELTKPELEILSKMAEGREKISDIANALKKGKAPVYKAIKKLENKGFVEKKNKGVFASSNTHVSLLMRVLATYPNASGVLKGSGIKVLYSILKSEKGKTPVQIVKETDIKKAMVYRIIKRARNIGIIIKENNLFVFNENLWPVLKEFIIEFAKYYENIDSRVPADSVIYYKNDKKIVFSNKKELDATQTAFSAFEDYGIKILNITYYYHLPKKKLTKKEVFQHAIYVAEKDKEIREIIFIALFYLKFKNELKSIKNELLDNIKGILKGKTIKGFPTLNEIKERAEVYDIRF